MRKTLKWMCAQKGERNGEVRLPTWRQPQPLSTVHLSAADHLFSLTIVMHSSISAPCFNNVHPIDVPLTSTGECALSRLRSQDALLSLNSVERGSLTEPPTRSDAVTFGTPSCAATFCCRTKSSLPMKDLTTPSHTVGQKAFPSQVHTSPVHSRDAEATKSYGSRTT
ncbi:unnamed protein product [Hydatigera taeniaeformis]|uniref:Uncharacterized protein n=1 Tax=Hydatigena taeniaeformis TaxID=6205 RepID=A0A0R3WXJ5_HYDTA|nr:unnamed protein product [Hydatigera taeniaeformis]